MKLADYRKKRDRARTNEPFGENPPEVLPPTRGGAFVFHQHDASRMHYDLRFEASGVLASFAVPRGPSLDPAARHLAVRTEDHPMEYLDFEAVIPDGQYGAGAMILWDRGRVRFLGASAEEGLASGKVDFELEGLKVRGRFALVRLKDSKKDEWLLLKKRDAFSSTERDPVRDQPASVLSGLTVKQLEGLPAIVRRLEERAAELGAPLGTVDARKVPPMLCSLSGAPVKDEGWLYELKLDGVRALATKTDAEVRLSGRKQRDTTASYPEVARAVRALAAHRAVLDGEIVAFDEAGQPSFQRLGQRIHLTRERDIRRAMLDVPVVYVVFDLLALGDRDLRELPLVRRKELLRELLPAPGVLRVLDHLEGDAEPLLAFCKERHLEGVVAKRAASPYRPGPRRTPDWVKMKCERDEELVIVGYTLGEGGRGRLGALDLATYDRDRGVLVHRGKVGSGLDDAMIGTLLALLPAMEVPESPAVGKVVAAPRGRVHVRPELVARVRFLGWSDDGQLRHPVFLGLRDDVCPTDCTAVPPFEPGGPDAPAEGDGDASPASDRAPDDAPDSTPGEAPAPEDAVEEPTQATLRARAGNTYLARTDAHDRPPAARPTGEPAKAAPARVVTVSNPGKVLWPGEGYTKTDLVGYYRAIAPTMLRYLADRPIMMVRYPDGILGKSFYQWNVPQGSPAWMRSARIRAEEDKDVVEVYLVDDASGLAHVANLAAIPIHILASRIDDLEQADFLNLDFDVKGLNLDAGVTLALTLRELLDAIGFVGFPKTSGQTGLHVFVPLGPEVSYLTARALADLLGSLLVRRHPELATMERVVAKRGPRVYVDTGQTGRSRTIVAPYSVRAQPGATVSTPLFWAEVQPGLDPTRFTIRTVPDRVRELGDPMDRLLDQHPSVPDAVARLEALVRKPTAG